MAITQCSQFTLGLYNYQRDFHRKHSEDSSVTGLIMTHVVGRIITAAVTLLLHAEAVSRAVAACFNNIRKVFSMSNEQLVQGNNELEYSKAAYSGSWKSFKALFNLSLLNEQDEFAPAPVEEAIPEAAAEAEEAGVFVQEEVRRPVPERPGNHAAPPAQDDFVIVVGAGHEDQQDDAPNVPQDAPIAGLQFGGDALNIVADGNEFQMPVFAQPIPVQPQMPNVAQGAPIEGLQFGDDEVNVVADGNEFQMPVFAQPIPVQPQMPNVAQGAPIEDLQFGDDEVNVVADGNEFQMPVFAQPMPVQPVAPEVRVGAALNALHFDHAEVNAVADGDEFQMPEIAQGVYVAPVMPQAQPRRAISPLLFGDHELNVVPEEALFVVPALAQSAAVQSVQVQLRQGQPIAPLVFDDAELNVVEPFLQSVNQAPALVQPFVRPLHLSPIMRGGDGDLVIVSPISPSEAQLQLNVFPPVIGFESPGASDEDYFSGQEKSQFSELTLKEAQDVIGRSDRENVIRSLRDAVSLASSHSSEAQRVVLHSAKDIVLGAEWQLASGFVEGYQISRCHFANGEIGMEYLVSVIPLTIKQVEHKIPIVGIFDPVIGSSAARFLRVNIVKALQNHLMAFNENEITPEGIWSAINLAYIQLAQMFQVNFPGLADQGCSATVVMEMDRRIWVINMGKTRAALNNQGRAFQCTAYDERGGFGFKGQRNLKPSITCYKLDSIGINSHIIIGNAQMFKTVGTATLSDWVFKNKDASLAALTRDMVFSATQKEQGAQCCFVMSLDHTDWEAV